MRTTCSSGGVRRALIGWSAARVPEVADARRQRNQDNSCRVPCLRAEQLLERERSERGAVAACGEPSFRPGRREGGAGSRLPGREPSGNPRFGPIPDPGSLCDLGLSGQRRPPFPTCGPPPRWFGACQPRGRRAGRSLPRSRGGGPVGAVVSDSPSPSKLRGRNGGAMSKTEGPRGMLCLVPADRIVAYEG